MATAAPITGAPTRAPISQTNLHLRIQRALRRYSIPPSTFGRRALGDPCLVTDLRNGRGLQPKTMGRLVEYLDRLDREGR